MVDPVELKAAPVVMEAAPSNQQPAQAVESADKKNVAATPAPTSTGETAEAANQAAKKVLDGGTATADPAVDQTGQQPVEPSMVQRGLSSVSDWVTSVKDTVGTAYTNVREFSVNKTNEAVEFVSYKSLNQMGEDAINYVATSAPVTKSQEFISKGVTFVGDNAPASSNWLPVSVAAGCVFASVKSIQAGVNNINLGNYKRAVCQIFVGASAAILAGSIAYQTPAGQAVKARVMGQSE